MARIEIDCGANFPVEQVDMEKGVRWLVRNSRGVVEEVQGWVLESVDGALVLRGTQSEFLRAWGSWTTVERKA